MDVIEAIRLRRSIRGFKPGPIPKEILKEILETALRSPSAVNSQPWEITVVSGEALENLKKSNMEMSNLGVLPRMEHREAPLEGVYRQRQIDVAIELFKIMGITREDKQKRKEWNQRGLRFFDAPAAIILSIDSTLYDSTNSLMDMGSITQTICLAAMNYGLGTCIEGQGVIYPDIVRKFTGIPESKRIIISIAIGYPDWDFPANKHVSSREPIENIVKWCE